VATLLTDDDRWRAVSNGGAKFVAERFSQAAMAGAMAEALAADQYLKTKGN